MSKAEGEVKVFKDRRVYKEGRAITVCLHTREMCDWNVTAAICFGMC